MEKESMFMHKHGLIIISYYFHFTNQIARHTHYQVERKYERFSSILYVTFNVA
jgi:hypothetical protein